MPCCRSTWCKDEKIVYTDKKKNEYCIFHAPKEHKGKTLIEFNSLVFEKIKKSKKENVPCDLSETIFPGSIDFTEFSNDNPLPELNFSKTIFNGKANFKWVTFSRKVDFWRTKFFGETDFYSVNFNGEADFNHTTFSDEADSEGTIFNINFEGATFDEKTNFLEPNLVTQQLYGSEGLPSKKK